MPSSGNAANRPRRLLTAALLLIAAAGIGGGLLTVKRLAFPEPPQTPNAIAADGNALPGGLGNGVSVQPRHPGMMPPGGSQDLLSAAAESSDPSVQLAQWSQRLARTCNPTSCGLALGPWRGNSPTSVSRPPVIRVGIANASGTAVATSGIVQHTNWLS